MKKTVILSMAVACGMMLNSCGTTTGLSYAGPQSAKTQTSTTETTLTGSAALGHLANGALSSVLGNSSSNTSGVLSSIISTFAGGLLTNQSTLVGNWSYTQPCVQFESENLLAKAGGAVAANSVSQKLSTYYEKVGIKPGLCSINLKDDNTCQLTVSNYPITGTYTFDANKKTMSITTNLGMQLTAYVSVTGNKLGLTFDATKLLSIIGSASSQVSSLSTLSSLVGNYSGMKIGFEFAK